MSHKGVNHKMSSFVRELSKTTILNRVDDNLRKHQWGSKREVILKLTAEEIEHTIVRYALVEEYLLGTTKIGVSVEFQAWLYALLSCRWDLQMEFPQFDSLNSAYKWISDCMTSALKQRLKPGVPEPPPVFYSLLRDNVQSCAYILNAYSLWKKCFRPTYLYSPDLATMLTHTKLDRLPVSHLNLPYAFVEFSIPEGVLPPYRVYAVNGEDFYERPIRSILVGNVKAYPEVGRPSGWMVKVMSEEPSGEVISLFNTNLYLETAKTVEDAVLHALTLDYKSHSSMHKDVLFEYLPQLFLFVAASVVYATMPSADAVLGETSPEYLEWAKRMSKVRGTKRENKDVAQRVATVQGTRRWFLGKGVRIIDRHLLRDTEDGETDGTRKSPKMHWRSGHMHLFWTGPRDKQTAVVKFVEPTIVGAPTYEGETPNLSRAGMR